MTQGIRHNQQAVSFLKEDNFLEKDPLFESKKKTIAAWDVGNDGLQRQTLDNEAVRTDLGENEAGVGLDYPESEFPVTVYPQGIGVGSVSLTKGIEDGDALQDVDGYGHLIGACLAGTPLRQSGCTVAVAPGAVATAALTITRPSVACEPANAPLNINAKTFLSFEDKTADNLGLGRVRTRPVLTAVDNDPNTDITLAMELPLDFCTALDVGAKVYGGNTWPMSEEVQYTIQGDSIGARETQNYEFFGCQGNFTFPEAAVAEAQTTQFTLGIGAFDYKVAKAKVSGATARPRVSAGGEFLLARYGQTQYLALKILRINIDLARTWTADPLGNEDDGVCGWVLTDQATRITLYVHDNETTPPGGSTTTFFDSFGPGGGGAENHFHLFCSWGNRYVGDLVHFYAPSIQQHADPVPTDIDEISARQLTFSLRQGGPEGVNKIWVGQS